MSSPQLLLSLFKHKDHALAIFRRNNTGGTPLLVGATVAYWLAPS
jgi:hypothetical protein